MNTHLNKRNYEIWVANEAKRDRKDFFKLYITKTREKIGPLKTTTGELAENPEDTS